MDAEEIFERDITKFERMIKQSERIVFFGGAGISTESGIPDFRSADGLYSTKYGSRKILPEEILSHTFFMSDAEEFYKFYREKMLYLSAKPNVTHKALAEMEMSGKNITIVTQNIDGLHQLAGSSKVIELHGSVHRNYCTDCGKFYTADFIKNNSGVPKCTECGGLIKPDVVLYEESLNENAITGAIQAISQADLLIIAGSSMTVYPAAGFVRYFRGKYSVVINLSEIENGKLADITFCRKAGDVFRRICPSTDK